jgi:prolyl 4-hydroxylase
MKNIINTDPQIYTIDNFLSDEECEHFINISKDKFTQALVSGNNGGLLSTNRTGKNCWINHDNDDITLKVAKRISELVDYPLENAESFQIIHYDKSQQYYNHCDGWLFNNSEKSNRCLLNGGQRMVTALVYLNNVEKGGETRFTKLDINIEPDKGKLLVFHNCYKDTNIVHKLSEHSGMPVIEGEKYAFNLWFRQQSRDKLYKYNYANTNEEQINTHDINILEKKMIISDNPLIYTIDNFLTELERDILIDKINNLKNTSYNVSREIYWINNNDISDLINKFSKILNISEKYFENLQIVKYYIGSSHYNYYDAFDNTTEIGKVYMKNRGQRLWSIMGFLENNNSKLKFNNINKEINIDKGKIVIIKNIIENTDNRDINTIKTITPIQKRDLYIFNLWIREK